MEPLDQLKNKTLSFLGDSKLSRSETAERLLQHVGLSETVLHQYPHELSGTKTKGVYCESDQYRTDVHCAR